MNVTILTNDHWSTFLTLLAFEAYFVRTIFNFNSWELILPSFDYISWYSATLNEILWRILSTLKQRFRNVYVRQFLGRWVSKGCGSKRDWMFLGMFTRSYEKRNWPIDWFTILSQKGLKHQQNSTLKLSFITSKHSFCFPLSKSFYFIHQGNEINSRTYSSFQLEPHSRRRRESSQQNQCAIVRSAIAFHDILNDAIDEINEVLSIEVRHQFLITSWFFFISRSSWHYQSTWISDFFLSLFPTFS